MLLKMLFENLEVSNVILGSLLNSVFVFLFSFFTSCIEIEIDPYGWTSKQYTTWHRTRGLLPKICKKPIF